ncbi:MAG: SUMF1/EgtB/PvdO family nonheme iron enzyme, partial [Deltaproteobacteria bacterium]|nr:SUMF1/EgtB/PvdO family nonheme iron enzyme [Deltaproteobacteria bacterium]
QQVNFEMYTMLLLDMSDSIVTSGNLGSMIAATRTLVNTLIAQGHKVAIYQFAGPAYFGEVQGFTADEDLLDAALDVMAESEGLGTTDLYGSIVSALNILDGTLPIDVLGTTTLVLFTDGTDEAMSSSPAEAQSSVDNTQSNVFTVGLGGDVNKEELKAFGKDGFQWAEDSDKLTDAFAEVTKTIQDIANSYYLIGVCSPRVGDWREMKVEVKRGGDKGSLTVYYNADGFDIVNCDPTLVAFPCQDKECDYVDSFFCGECTGTTFCNEQQMCEDACADAECGYSLGVECGDCSEQGDDFVCEDNQCIQPCEDAEADCGFVLGIDCGDCTDEGETWTCDDHTCVDACATIECGMNLGIDCGDCSSYGVTYACDAGTCVDACDGHECGTWMDVECGDCTDEGETWGCDETGTCIDACVAAQCGMVDDVDCGDCSDLGWQWGCDDTNTCVEACVDAECGEIWDVDCGDCETGDMCNSSNQCVPFALAGMEWISITGGSFTLGCNTTLDVSCDTDELRHEVSLVDYYIMDTEVTVAMYNLCVADSACNSSNVAMGGQCNYDVGGKEDHPINCISWAGLQEFCIYVGGDIATEAQWERAYRGDHDGVIESYWIYPWGTSPSPSCTHVVMDDGGPGCGLGGTDEVKTKPVTELNLYNMGGNVAEWVLDWYGDELGGCVSYPCADPDGPDTGAERVTRGGAWNDIFNSAFRTARRDSRDPTSPIASVGGRCTRLP